MYVRKISARSPDQVFTTVRNNGSVSMDRGHGVLYDYTTDSSTPAFEGFGVKYAEDYWPNTFVNPLQFAGVVVGRQIPPGGYGSIQIWGHCLDPIVVGADTNGTSPLFPGITIAVINDTDIGDFLFMRPMGISITDAMPGAFALLRDGRSVGQRYFVAHPCVQILDAVIPSGATTYGTLTHNQTGTTKGFVRCI